MARENDEENSIGKCAPGSFRAVSRDHVRAGGRDGCRSYLSRADFSAGMDDYWFYRGIGRFGVVQPSDPDPVLRGPRRTCRLWPSTQRRMAFWGGSPFQ